MPSSDTFQLSAIQHSMEDVLERTREFVEDKQEVMPTAFLFTMTANGPKVSGIIGLSFSDDTKQAAQRAVTDMSLKPGAYAVALLCDSYVLMTPDPEDLKRRVRDNPKRQEALSIRVIVQGEIVSMGGQVYHRTDAGIRWEPTTWWDGNETQTNY
jgi:hypothetical protein